MSARHMGSSEGTKASTALLQSFCKKYLYIAVIAAIMVLASYAVVAQLSPKYRAEATILVDTALMPTRSAAARDYVAMQLQLLRSRDLVRTVARSLGYGQRSGLVPAPRDAAVFSNLLKGLGLEADASKVTVEEQMLETFVAHLTVSANENAQTIVVAFTSGDPQLAADAANAVATEYVALHRTVTRGLSLLETKIGDLTDHIDAIEAKARTYRAGIENLSHGTSVASDASRRRRAVAQLQATLSGLEDQAARLLTTRASQIQRHKSWMSLRERSFFATQPRILSLAAAPEEPYFPQTGPITVVVGVLALIITVAFAAVRELAQRRQKRSVGHVPIPEIADSRISEYQPRSLDDHRSARSTIVAPLPTFADRRAAGDGRSTAAIIAEKLVRTGAKRIMVVTSGGLAGRRRSLAAVALVRALAHADRRAVLVDLHDDGADSAAMGVGITSCGFFALAAGEASFGQVIFRDRVSRAHLIPAGREDTTCKDLSDERVGVLVTALDHTYDHVVFDVGDDVFEAVGAKCDTVVVAGSHDNHDSGVALAVARSRAHSTVRVIVMRFDQDTETPDVGRRADVSPKAA